MVPDEEELNPEDEYQDEPEQLRDIGSSDNDEDPIEQVPSLGTAGESETVYMTPVDPDSRPEPVDEGDEDKPFKESKSEQVEDHGPQDDSRLNISLPNTIVPDSSIRPVDPVDPKDLKPEKPTVPPLKTAGEGYSRDDDKQNLGPMSFYKRKNLSKGREVPGIEKGKDGNYRQIGNLDSGQERDEEGLRQQKDLDLNQNVPQGGGPLAVDLQPDIIPDVGFDGASSFKPEGQDSTQTLNDVESAADAVDTLTTGLLNVLVRLTLNMKKANDNIRQLMDKLEVEDHRDEF